MYHNKLAAGGNPVQQMAKDALKVAKSLEDLKNQLAALPNRQEIAQVAGLENIAGSIERLYELADQYRKGGTEMQGVSRDPGLPAPPQQPEQSEQPVQAAYFGWDPSRLMSAQGKSFVDTSTKPIEVVEEDAEKYIFPREKQSSPHQPDQPISE
ncbi:MAG: hypothetical protein A2Y38_11885 [Spirochaetes bacterium GWB1_59_5]|nr:MAG: hypothetical protein A2Y38_11885 [Spirochaetes bacterium GWB1_59_5]